MESRGLVRREHDPADKRRRFVYLTAEGEALLASSMPLGNAVDEEFLGRLNDEERQQFSQIIHKLIARETQLTQALAEKINKRPDPDGNVLRVRVNRVHPWRGKLNAGITFTSALSASAAPPAIRAAARCRCPPAQRPSAHWRYLPTAAAPV